MTKAERRNAICAEVVRLMANERERLKLSRNALASLTGLNQSTVSRLENYHDNPTMDSLLRVGDALGINLGEFLRQAIENVDRQDPGSSSRATARR